MRTNLYGTTPVRQRRITIKGTIRKMAQKPADECEKASRTKRSLKRAQAVLDRLREELYGERVVRISLRQYLDNWINAKEAETAASTMNFYRGCLVKFLGSKSFHLRDSGRAIVMSRWIHCCLGYTPVNRMIESKFIFRNTSHMADSSLGSTFRTSSL